MGSGERAFGADGAVSGFQKQPEGQSDWSRVTEVAGDASCRAFLLFVMNIHPKGDESD